MSRSYVPALFRDHLVAHERWLRALMPFAQAALETNPPEDYAGRADGVMWMIELDESDTVGVPYVSSDRERYLPVHFVRWGQIEEEMNLKRSVDDAVKQRVRTPGNVR